MGFFNWVAPAFNRFADRWSPQALAKIADRLRPFLGERCAVLDLGGGTGALAVHLAESLDANVTILDATPEMLAYVPEHEHVTGIVGCAEKMPFDDDTFDVVVISDAFHHFRDQDGAIREIKRVARPGGGLMIDEFHRTGVMRPIVWGEMALGEPGSFFTPEELCAYLHERGIEGTCHSTSRIGYYFIGSVP